MARIYERFEFKCGAGVSFTVDVLSVRIVNDDSACLKFDKTIEYNRK